jgi:putative pyruvate formate lyase activating enzyme
MPKNLPSYLSLYKSGELHKRAEVLQENLSACTLCPRECRVDRLRNEKGVCGASTQLRIAKAIPHFGEEPPVSGTNGSGTIFFSFCSLKCCFCQNFQISQENMGQDLSEKELAKKMLSLQEKGCHNINLVSASHFLPQIIDALCLAVESGLILPLVYNTSGYENLWTLKQLEGIVDIYLPDAKYSDDFSAQKYSGVKNYSSTNLLALKEMFRQVGHLKLDKNGFALNGLIVRHLVLPENLSNTINILKNQKNTIGTELSISFMSQHKPRHKAAKNKGLSVPLPEEQYLEAVGFLCDLEFENGWVQDWEPYDKSFVPDFKKRRSWN